MSDEHDEPSEAIRDSAANTVVRRLEWRYLIVLLAVAALVVVDQAIVQPMLVHVNAFAPAINIAGRQRMLSQRLTKATLALRDAEDAAARDARLEELRHSLAQWIAEHDALVHGEPSLGVRPIRTGELQAAWLELAPHYDAMVAAAGAIVEGGGRETLAETPSPVAELVEHEAHFLPTMDRIVKLMEDEAANAVFRLRASALGIAGLVMLLLVGLGWFVVRPATRTIRTQVDELEARVAQRTAELASALESLQREVHEREEAELKNQRLAAQLTHTERVTTMGHLTAGLAHELNQPLAAITNYTEACEVLLQEVSATPGPLERVTELVVKAKRSALRAGQIVRRMRNFVRPNAGVHNQVALNTLISDTVELCRADATNADAELRLQLLADDDCVLADSIQIQQVVVNLVQNALQAMSAAGSREREVTIRTANIGERVQVEVCDTGPGFATSDPDVAFAPFHTTKQDGLGIGLSICRSIVESHRGRIWTESRPGRGAQVSFTLPLAAEHVPRHRTEPDCLCC